MAISEHWRVIHQRHQRIKGYHMSGWTAREMAVELAVSRWTVFNDLKTLGLKPIDGRRKRLTAKQAAAFILWQKHKNYSIVGELLGIRKSTARRHVLAYQKKQALIKGESTA